LGETDENQQKNNAMSTIGGASFKHFDRITNPIYFFFGSAYD